MEDRTEKYLGALSPPGLSAVEREHMVAGKSRKWSETETAGAPSSLHRPDPAREHTAIGERLDLQAQERTTVLEQINRALHAEVLERKRTEEDLRVRERRWYAIFAQASVGLSEISLRGKFERLNDKLCSLIGRSRSTLLAASLVEVTHPEDLQASLAVFRRVVATGESGSLDQRYIQANGKAVWVNVGMSRLDDSDGRPRSVLTVVLDLTERKRAEIELYRSEAEFRAVFELAAVGIAQVDARKKKILRVNRRFSDLVGYNEFELRQMSFADLERSRGNVQPIGLFERLMADGVNEYSKEEQIRRKDGSLLWVHVTASLIRDAQDRPWRTLAVVQDITERKAAEDELHRAREQLEARVRQRTTELDQVNRMLMSEIVERKRAEEERQSVLSQLVTAQEEERRRISRELHDDIGQHLTALMLGLKAIDPCNPLSITKVHLEKLQQITEIVGKEVHELALELRPTALDDLGLVRTLTNYLEEWGTRSSIEVDFHTLGLEERLPPPVETTLYRIVQESLNNVLKHARAKRVSVIVERRGDQAVAIIEDDGCGFDLDSLEKADTRQRLGLLGMEERASLVRGELSVETSPGRGTTVFVHIPIPQPARPETPQHG